MAVISGSWKAFDMLCGQIAANSLMHEKLEVLAGSVIYSNFQMDALDDDSLSINVSLVSFAYFSLFLLIDMTKGHKLFKDHLIHLKAELPVQRWQKKVIYFFFLPSWNCMGKRWKCVDFLNNPIELTPLLALFLCYRLCDSSYPESWRLRLLCPVHI